MLRGKFKEHPNNPRRPDGSIHEYCPPEHVDSEIENLLEWFGDCRSDDPIVVAAWLHHQFTQIHPYQDGNGRVSRALTTYVLLEADLLPLVVDRDLRGRYIAALETADGEDLTDLASLFANLERKAILRALSVDADAEISHDRSITEAVIQDLASKLARRKAQQVEELRRVNDLARALRARARVGIERQFAVLSQTVRQLGEPRIHVTDGGPDHDNAHWYKFEVVESSKSSGSFVNFSEAHFFVKATIRVSDSRLVFVVSLHHVGRALSGIMEVTTFARLESFEDSDDRAAASASSCPCSLDPFVIAWNTVESDVGASFDKWLDAALAVAVKRWGDQL